MVVIQESPVSSDAQEAYEPGKVYSLKLTKIQPNPHQPRTYFDPEGIEELARSIDKSGLHAPILFQVVDGKPILVAGERRLKAHLALGRETIPALLVEGDPREIALIENIVREDITAIEEAQAMKAMIDQHQYTQDKLASILGKSPASISQSISISTIDESLISKIQENNPKCPKWILYEVAKVDKKKQRAMYSKFDKKGLTREEYRKGSTTQNPKQPIYIATDLAKKLVSADLESWTEDDKQKLYAALRNLRILISRVIPQENEVE